MDETMTPAYQATGALPVPRRQFRNGLKMLALLTMTVDHIGAVLYPQVMVFRIIGRIAFPIFAYLIARGYEDTSSVQKYLLRLVVFAFISAIPFSLAIGHGQNIFFTLALGLLAILLFDRYGKLGKVAALAMCAVGEILNVDYGWYGVLTILAFHMYRRNRVWGSLVFTAGTVLISLQTALAQVFALAALLAISIAEGQEGDITVRVNKYAFYAYYPFHLLVLYLLK